MVFNVGNVTLVIKDISCDPLYIYFTNNQEVDHRCLWQIYLVCYVQNIIEGVSWSFINRISAFNFWTNENQIHSLYFFLSFLSCVSAMKPTRKRKKASETRNDKVWTWCWGRWARLLLVFYLLWGPTLTSREHSTKKGNDLFINNQQETCVRLLLHGTHVLVVNKSNFLDFSCDSLSFIS